MEFRIFLRGPYLSIPIFLRSSSLNVLRISIVTSSSLKMSVYLLRSIFWRNSSIESSDPSFSFFVDVSEVSDVFVSSAILIFLIQRIFMRINYLIDLTKMCEIKQNDFVNSIYWVLCGTLFFSKYCNCVNLSIFS